MFKICLKRSLISLVFMVVTSIANCPSRVAADSKLLIRVLLPANRADLAPMNGRLFVFSTTNQQMVPIQGPSWFRPEPFLGKDIGQWNPGETVVMDDDADGFPARLSQWPKTKRRVQAIFDRDFDYPKASQGPGNLFSSVVEWDPESQTEIELILDQVVPQIEYRDTDRVKFLQRKSACLTEHFGRDVIDRVAVILPDSYDRSLDRRYPVDYEITGFGGHLPGVGRSGRERRVSQGDDSVEFIRVLLTGECKLGHHVYANSVANGPRGDQLVHEMIPYIDQSFRTIADPKARFVSGHSSGGWSSLWLQVSYPEVFGGVFSTSPDPVDFRDFQGTDLYAQPPESVYMDPSENRRPLARQQSKVVLWYDDFCKMDQVLGFGGQMRSFDAVFSPLDSNGIPRRAWEPTTGQVNAEVIQNWRKYDISQKIASEWSTLGPRLQGKIHIAMGELDTFYLEGAVRLLKSRLEALGSDAKIEIVPGASHSLPPEVMRRMKEHMQAKFLEGFDVLGAKKTN
jgi:S-formylglutathione hydrolase FrmB